MKEFIRNISFTKNEIQVILFIVIVVTSGFAVKYYKHVFIENYDVIYDYTESDNKFRELSDKMNNRLLSANTDSSGFNSQNYESSENTDQTDEILLKKILNSEDSLKESLKLTKEKETDIPDTDIVNINTATKEELVDLPGVGESTAEKILDYRNEKKGFKRKEDLMNVKGIGKKKFDNIKKYIKTE